MRWQFRDYGFKKLGAVTLSRTVGPMIEWHRDFLAKTEEQLV